MSTLAHKIKTHTMVDLEAVHDRDVWAELIDGQLYTYDCFETQQANLPYDFVFIQTPGTRHQQISGEITMQIYNYLQGKKPKIFYGLGVQFSKEDRNYFVPDISIICDPSKLKPRGCVGIPDFIIEILSPCQCNKRDTVIKFRHYLQAGVPEYWIVDPEENTVTMHRLVGNHYATTVRDETETAPIACLPGFEVELSSVFAIDPWVANEEGF